MEYSDLSLDERLALLQGLLEQALDCEEVRELMTSKVEAMALPRQKKPVSHCHSTSMFKGCPIGVPITFSLRVAPYMLQTYKSYKS